MSFFRKLEISIALSLFISIIFSVFSFAHTAKNIRDNVLRLHIIANSDSAIDQNLKLAVRDALLSAGEDVFDGSVNIDNAKERIEPKIFYLEDVAKEIIVKNGFDYNVKINLEKEYFTTRTYESVTLPAGDYLALKVVIGEGVGKNWWCVMFPPMCLSAANEVDVLKNFLNGNEVKLVNKNPKYEVRFKILELFESAKRNLLK